jgi:hypothetical protein
MDAITQSGTSAIHGGSGRPNSLRNLPRIDLRCFTPAKSSGETGNGGVIKCWIEKRLPIPANQAPTSAPQGIAQNQP